MTLSLHSPQSDQGKDESTSSYEEKEANSSTGFSEKKDVVGS